MVNHSSILIILGSIIAILILVFVYVRNTSFLFKKLFGLHEEKLLPINWLWFAIFPFVGNLIFQDLDNILCQLPELKLTPKRLGISNPLPFVDSRWVLFQEQYDRKSSAIHGTKIRFLLPNSHFNFIAKSSNETMHDSKKILIELARKHSTDVQWGTLSYHSPNWKITNNKVDTVVPIIKSDSNTIDICRPGQATVLYGKEKFIFGLSEFNLYLLPELYIITFENGRFIYHCLNGETVFFGSANIQLDKRDSSTKGSIWEIKNRILTIHGQIEFTKVTSGIPMTIQIGEIILSAGDKFRIPNTGYKFWIDYQKI